MDIYLTTSDKVKDIVEFAFGLKVHLSNVAFSIGGYNIYWYGIIITIGMVLALIFGFRKTKEFGINPDKLLDCIIFGVIGAFIGARAYYVIFSPADIRESYKTFWDVVNLRDGGLAIYGGVIGALIFGVAVAKIRKLKVAPLLDMTGLGFLIGQAVGRWGNFFNREAYGVKTSLPFGMTSVKIASEMGSNAFVHPTFLYESLWCLLVFILLRVYMKHRKFDGELFLMYIGLYGFERFFVEGLRTDSLVLGKIRISQLVAGLCVIFAIVAIIIIRSKVKRNDEYKLYRDTEESKNELLAYKESKKKKSEKDTEIVEETVEETEDKAEETAQNDEILPEKEENIDISTDENNA